MIKEIKGICKDCGEEFVFSKEVFDLMKERGETKPERCPKHQKQHREEIKGIGLPYFLSVEKKRTFPDFDFSERSYEYRGKRPIKTEERKPSGKEIKIRITDQHIVDLYKRLDEAQVIVLASPTGTGKSTYVPTRLIVPPDDYPGDFVERILHQGQFFQTQPLSSAVERIPNTISKDLLGSSGVGEMKILGLRHRGMDRYDRKNLGVIVTDGSLRNWIRDGYLNQYSLIMIDESHQRTCNIDTILMLLKHELLKNPNLRVIISSATIDTDEFKSAFEEEGISVSVFDLSETLEEEINYFGPHFWQGKTVKGCECWLCSDKTKRQKFWKKRVSVLSQSDLVESAADFAVKILEETEKGGILVFLHGQNEVENTAKLIEQRKKKIDSKGEIPVIPIYSALGEEEVSRRFNLKGKRRRVLVTTNIAETSHTLDDIVYVIDSGYIKETQWDIESQSSHLRPKFHSKAGCRQRWGRVGRVQVGYVYCLFTEEQFNDFDDYTKPEIFRSCLDDLLLTLRATGVSEDIPWIGKPDKEVEKELKRSVKAVEKESFIDKEGDIKEETLEIFHIPKRSDEIALLRLADEKGCLLETAIALSFISTPEGEVRTGAGLYNEKYGLLSWNEEWSAKEKEKVFAIHQGLKKDCKDDLDFVIKLAICFKKKKKRWTDKYFINYKVLNSLLLETEEFVKSFRTKIKEEIKTKEEIREIDPSILNRIRSLMLIVWPERVIKLENSKSGIISEFCVGDWRNQKKAIYAAATKDKVIIGENKVLAPVYSFMVQIPDKKLEIENNLERFFKDPEIPIYNWKSIKKKEGETLEVKVDQVFKRDPRKKTGWITVKTKEGIKIPVDLSEITLLSSGYGLDRLKGKKLNLVIKDFDETGWPRLSNLNKVMDDLTELKKRIETKGKVNDRINRKYIEVKGYIEDIQEENERIIVIVPRKEGVIHHFEVKIDNWCVPGGKANKLKIGEEVLVELYIKKNNETSISNLILGKEEKETKPRGWEYDEENCKLVVPCFLEKEDFQSWVARQEIKDRILRHSWQYCFDARIAPFRERLSQLKVGDLVKGTIVELVYDSSGEQLKSVQVILKDGTPGFAFREELDENEIKEGTEILLEVRKVNSSSGFLRLASRRARLKQRINRNESKIIRLKRNIESNKIKKATARTSGFANVVQEWIDQDQQKIKHLEEENKRLRQELEETN